MTKGKCVIIFVLLSLLLPSVLAADVAYIYRKTTRIDNNVLDSFSDLGLSYDLISASSLPSNFNNYKLIFIGDERFLNPSEIWTRALSQKPSVIANSYHGDDWGLVNNKVSSLAGTEPLEVRIVNDGVRQVYDRAFYKSGSTIAIPYYYLANTTEQNWMAPGLYKHAGTYLGDSYELGAVIAYGNENAQLYGGKRTGGKICFYGIDAFGESKFSSEFWTNHAEDLFEDCVSFVAVVCYEDDECDDDNECTDDVCQNEGTVNSYCENTFNEDPCNDGLYCTVNDVCEEGECVSGDERDCSDNNIFVNECFYDPDNIDFTFDYYSFESVCDESENECTEAPTSWEDLISHDCDESCGAECILDEDCTGIYCTQQSHKTYPSAECDECECEGTGSPQCIVGSCGALCDEDEDCSCQVDYCDGTTLVDYPDYGRCGTAGEEGCLCQISEEEGGDCEPVLIPTHPDCYIQECGNGILDPGEQCEIGDIEARDCGSDIGECEFGTETRNCIDCTWQDWGDCVGGQGPVDELCDGLDNDCDSSIDEDFTELGESCSVGIGECEASGIYVCSLDELSTECDAVPGTPETEICDNKDNDCDTQIDEDLERGCGSGACEGIEVCSSGVWGDCSSLNNDCGICALCDIDGECSIYDETQDSDCDDGLYCNGEETCGALFECYEEPGDINCDDSISCTIDSCNEATDSCDNAPDDNLCDDDLFCNGEETCDAELDCQAGTDVDCSGFNIPGISTCFNNPDNIDETFDFREVFLSFCNESVDSCILGDETISHTCDESCGADAECDNLFPGQGNCTFMCEYKPPYICVRDGEYGEGHEFLCREDNTYDRCNEQGDGYVHINICSYECTADLACEGIIPGESLERCDFNEPFLEDYCNLTCHVEENWCEDDFLGCTAEPECDEQEPGIGDCNMQCELMGCGTNEDCDDNNICTDDFCIAHNCEYSFNTNPCDDNLFCTVNDICEAGVCGGETRDCSDNIGCTVDSCNEATDSCDNVADDSLCDDGLFCNGEETCDVELDCQAGIDVDCSIFNIPEIFTCDYSPDDNPFTFDFRNLFVSVCDEDVDECTQGDATINHECSILECSAECEDNSDCEDTVCEDGCIGNDYYDYDDVGNDCVDCYCEENECGEPEISYNDSRCEICEPFSTGKKCLDYRYRPLSRLSKYVVSQQWVERQWGFFGHDWDREVWPWDGLCGHDGYYVLDNKKSKITVETPELPEAGTYDLYIHYLIGDQTPVPNLDEDWGIRCGEQEYIIEDPCFDVHPMWLWEKVTCEFEQGKNTFELFSTGWNEVGVEEFKIKKTC